MPFKSEANLLEVLLDSNYKSTFGFEGEEVFYGLEIEGLFGIPDIVFVYPESRGGHFQTVAVELKLSNWRRALVQAFRYRAFANSSFVLMDKSKVRPALNNLQEFSKRNIGLMSIDTDGTIVTYHKPPITKPYSVQLKNKFENIFETYRDKELFVPIQ